MVQAPHLYLKFCILAAVVCIPFAFVFSVVDITGCTGNYQVLLPGTSVTLRFLELIVSLGTDIVAREPCYGFLTFFTVQLQRIFYIEGCKMITFVRCQSIKLRKKRIGIGTDFLIRYAAFLGGSVG